MLRPYNFVLPSTLLRTCFVSFVVKKSFPFGCRSAALCFDRLG